ncbi:MAG TPA: GspH/FimT family pseudopilin [Gemmatimonadaceae bacterium]|nr:GspH/FimT family pseudopilin [Gemmatimonadaceae bacterium]
MRRGATLSELVMVLTIIGILALVARPAFGGLYDRAAVISATSEVVALIGAARQHAITEGRIVAVRLDAPSGRVIAFADRDTFHLRDVRQTHGVTLITSRDSIAFYPTGRGYGAANTSVILERGQAADTILVSRLGRVRR